jgi:hypothetical protein
MKISSMWDIKIYRTFSHVFAFVFSFCGAVAFLMDHDSHLPRLGAFMSFPIPATDWPPLLSVIRYFPHFFNRDFHKKMYTPIEIKTCFFVCEFYDAYSFCACLWYLIYPYIY